MMSIRFVNFIVITALFLYLYYTTMSQIKYDILYIYNIGETLCERMRVYDETCVNGYTMF